MIYIDSPYNTGNDSFIYLDDFSERKEEYLLRTGELIDSNWLLKNSGQLLEDTREAAVVGFVDDASAYNHLHIAKERWFKNRKENGRFHSNWLSMMLPRLYLAKSLLCEDGVIFISIDDNEVYNLRLVMNEIFEEESISQEIVDAVIAAQPHKEIALDKLFDGNDQLKTNTALQIHDADVEFWTV
ncbi:MAG: DNA methyltransferase [Treponema sp.]